MSTSEEYVKKMHESLDKAYDCLTLLQTALSLNSMVPLQECREKTAIIKKIEADLAGKITTLAQENVTLRAYLSVPLLVQRIGGHIDNLNETINKKIKNDILFSDRAVSELTILFHKLKEALKSTSDLLVTKNRILVQHVNECEEDVLKKALEYATLHEERLVEGLCLPASSPLFLNMLNSLRCIAWDVKEIAMKFLLNE